MCSAEVGSPEVLLFIECRQAAEAKHTAPTRCQLDPTLLWEGCRGCPPPPPLRVRHQRPVIMMVPLTASEQALAPLSFPFSSTHEFPSPVESPRRAAPAVLLTMHLLGRISFTHEYHHLADFCSCTHTCILCEHDFPPPPHPLHPPTPNPSSTPCLNLHRTEERFALVSLME